MNSFADWSKGRHRHAAGSAAGSRSKPHVVHNQFAQQAQQFQQQQSQQQNLYANHHGYLGYHGHYYPPEPAANPGFDPLIAPQFGHEAHPGHYNAGFKEESRAAGDVFEEPRAAVFSKPTSSASHDRKQPPAQQQAASSVPATSRWHDAQRKVAGNNKQPTPRLADIAQRAQHGKHSNAAASGDEVHVGDEREGGGDAARREEDDEAKEAEEGGEEDNKAKKIPQELTREEREALRNRCLSAPEAVQVAEQLQELMTRTTAILSISTSIKTKEEHEREAQLELERQQEAKKRRAEDKQRMESFLQLLAKDEKMPLWRHKEMGRDVSKLDPQYILKGKQLFKVIALCILKLYIKPLLASKKRSLARRDSERSDFAKTLKLYLDTCEFWMGKHVKLPVLSIEHDHTLNFSPRQEVFESRSEFSKRMLQLKVRLKSIVTSIANSPMPSERVSNFLATLTEDGNYFEEGFLFDCETESLNFTDLGATRDMIKAKVTPPGEDGNAAAKNILAPAAAAAATLGDDGSDAGGPMQSSEAIDSLSNDGSQENEEDSEELLVRCSRIKMLLKNYVLVRILVSRVILSPWNCGLGHPPHPARAASVLRNFRILASALYEVCRQVDTSLPEVRPPQTEAAKPTGFAAMSMSTKASAPLTSSSVKVIMKTTAGPTPRAAPPAVPPLDIESAGALSKGAEADPGSPGLLSPRNDMYYHSVEASGGNVFQNAWRHVTNAGVTVANMAIYGFEIMQRANDSFDSYHYSASQGASMQDKLLSNGLRPQYEQLQEIHQYLFPLAYFPAVMQQHYLNNWVAELSPLLDDWLNQLTLHVVKTRKALRSKSSASRGQDDDAEEADDDHAD